MAEAKKLTFYHCPPSRSSMTLLLLEELGVPYELKAMNLKAGENRQPAYLAVNPMGKVPAIRHGDALITETVAVFIYLADAFPEAKLAPPIGDPLRGPYLRWLVFYAASFEPALADRAMKREPPPLSMSPYGDFDSVARTLNGVLSRGPYVLGERFSAADVLWGAALDWVTKFGLMPETPEIKAYLARHHARPAVARAKAKDDELAKAFG